MTKLGDIRRTAVLDRAVHVASLEGIEGLTFGRLADATRLGKSALQTLFGTKENLQLAIVTAAAEVYDRDVRRRAEDRPDGLARLRALLHAWLDYLESFEGGCVFVAAATELDGRPGPVRDAVARAVVRAEELLRRQAALAVRLGELPADTDIDQLIYELHGLVLQANHDRQLLHRPEALARAARAVDRLLTAEHVPRLATLA